MMTSQTEAVREKQQWWYIHDWGEVEEVTGYSCAPNNPDVWWCPEVGYTCQEGYHLFKTEKEALEKSVGDTKKRIQDEQDMLAELSERLNRLSAQKGTYGQTGPNKPQSPDDTAQSSQ